MQAIHPDRNVNFRIQSVAFLTCLELLDGSDPDETGFADVQLRPVNDMDYQLWRFVQYDSGYIVHNVANSNQRLKFNGVAGVVSACNVPESVQVSYRDGAYHLAFQNGYRELCAHGSYDPVGVAPFGQSDVQRKWHLVPVIDKDPPLEGRYRIRSHDGKNLLTMPEESTGDTNVYIRSQIDYNGHQLWTVTRESYRRYTIQNHGSKLYLGCSAASTHPVRHGLEGLEHKYFWDIHNVGASWSLRIPESGLSIGVADYEIHDRDEVCLVPPDNTYSQLWFMESYHPIVRNKMHAGRVVKEGVYLLRNANDNLIYMNAYRCPWRVVPGSLTTSKFELKYINERSGRFKLTVADANPVQEVAVIEDRVDHIGLKGKGTEFVLLKGDPGHVICLPDSGHPRKVVSGRTTTDNNKNSVFSVDKKVAEDLIQMWILVPTK